MRDSFFIRLGLPKTLSAEARETFSAIVPRIAGNFSFQGLEDWSVDVKNSRVLGAESEFHDLTRVGARNHEMRVYFAKRGDALLFGQFLASAFADLKVGSVRKLAPRDWMKLWRRHYKTQILREGRERLAVVPSWKKVPRATPFVRISPGQAFGTGTHPTTQLCLKLLLRYGTGKRALDFGAGTGVLSIAASKLGAARVRAVESDPVALAQCRKNARLNRARGLAFSRSLGRGQYDLVFANVLAPVLLEFRPRLHAAVAKGGLIFLSGILKSESADFLQKFRAQGFITEDVLFLGDWSAIALRRRL